MKRPSSSPARLSNFCPSAFLIAGKWFPSPSLFPRIRFFSKYSRLTAVSSLLFCCLFRFLVFQGEWIALFLKSLCSLCFCPQSTKWTGGGSRHDLFPGREDTSCRSGGKKDRQIRTERAEKRISSFSTVLQTDFLPLRLADRHEKSFHNSWEGTIMRVPLFVKGKRRSEIGFFPHVRQNQTQ